MAAFLIIERLGVKAGLCPYSSYLADPALGERVAR